MSPVRHPRTTLPVACVALLVQRPAVPPCPRLPRLRRHQLRQPFVPGRDPAPVTSRLRAKEANPTRNSVVLFKSGRRGKMWIGRGGEEVKLEDGTIGKGGDGMGPGGGGFFLPPSPF